MLLHGFSASSQAWGDVVVDGLASAGLRPTLLDLPGHGRRSRERGDARYTLEAVHRDIGRALGPDPAPLVGYSMGGRVALSFAVAHPHRVSHLVLESASPGLETPGDRAARRADDEALADRIVARGVPWFVDHWEALPLFASRARLPGAERARQRALREANDPEALARALRKLGTGALPSLWDRLGGLEVPTLLLVGGLDTKFVDIGRRMVEGLPAALLRIVPDAGHTVHLERPDAWLDAVVPFLHG